LSLLSLETSLPLGLDCANDGAGISLAVAGFVAVEELCLAKFEAILCAVVLSAADDLLESWMERRPEVAFIELVIIIFGKKAWVQPD
jgi:hypothetical protein